MLIFGMVMDDGPIQLNDVKNHAFDLDESLIQRIAHRDMAAFDELYYKTEKILYSYILSFVKQHDDTLDLLQETYVKLMNSSHLYQPMGKPMAWLFTISKNLAISHLRSKKNYVDVDVIDLENDISYSYVDNNTDNEVLRIALNILSEEERTIVLLSAISGLKHREIANNLDLKLSTVLSKYHRAIKKMREHIRKEGLM